MIGCGNSGMSDDMYNDGFENILSVDYSDTVIRQMRQRFPYLKYEVADVRHMDEYACASFPFIIDKGTMDAILCGNDATANAFMMLRNMDRLMPVGGVAVFITYGTLILQYSNTLVCQLIVTFLNCWLFCKPGEPESRRPFLSLISHWSVSHIVVGDSRYMYTCVKQPSDASS
jgi:hypothetical protein